MTRGAVLPLERLALTLAGATLAWGPLAQGSTFGLYRSGLTLLGLLTAACTLLALGLRGRLSADLRWSVTALALLAWIWLSILWAPYTAEAVSVAAVWTANLGVALTLALLATSRRRLGAVLALLALTGTAALALAWLQTRGVFVPGFQYDRGVGPGLLSGPYFNPSHFSGFLIPLAALLGSLTLFRRLSPLTLLLLALLVGLNILDLKTDSSSIPAVLLASVLPLLVWCWTRSRVLGAALTGLLVCGAGLGAAYFLTPQGQALFAREQARIGIHRDWSSFLHQREAVWHYGVAMWRDHSLSGLGIGQFVSEAPHYRRPERQVGAGMDRQAVNYAHNDALQLASELGVPGVALFAALLVLPLGRRSGVSSPSPLPWLNWWATLPPLLLVSVYDAHLTAIPGTSLWVLALAALAAHPVQVAEPGSSPA